MKNNRNYNGMNENQKEYGKFSFSSKILGHKFQPVSWNTYAMYFDIIKDTVQTICICDLH